jgi:ABC-2 type transport system permease protein
VAGVLTPLPALAGMKWRMLRHSMTGTRAGLTGLGAALGVALAGAGVLVALSHPASAALAVTALWTVGWLVGSTLTGGESVLRVRFFGLLPLRPRQLSTGLYATAFLGVGPAVTLLACAVLVVLGVRLGPGAAVLAVPAAVLHLAFVVAVSRVLVDVLGAAARSRLGAEVGAAVFGFVVAFLYAGWGLLGAAGGTIGGLSPVLRALPSGWAAGAVLDAGAGRWWRAAAELVGLAAVCVLLVAVWSRLLVRRIVAEEPAVAVRRASGRRLLPATPFGAVLGRELRTWWRDPHRGRLIRLALWSGVFFTVLSLVGGWRFFAPWSGCLTALYAVAFGANLYGFDGSALWLTLSAPGAVRADVRARQVAWLLVVAPAALVLTAVGVVGSGAWWALPWAFGLCCALLGGGAGFLVLYAVLAPAPVTDPHRRGSGALLSGDDVDGGRSQAQGQLVFWSTAAAALPTTVVLAAGAALHLPLLLWAGIPVGAGTGLLAAWLLGAVAHRRLASTGPELLALLRHGPAASTGSGGDRRGGRVAGRPGAGAVPLPTRLSVPVGLMMTLAVVMVFPQGLVPLVFAVFGVDHRVRVWFLARYLAEPWQVPAALAFLLAGLALGTTGILLVRRYRRRAATA